jgi:hypothetical protein
LNSSNGGKLGARSAVGAGTAAGSAVGAAVTATLTVGAALATAVAVGAAVSTGAVGCGGGSLLGAGEQATPANKASIDKAIGRVMWSPSLVTFVSQAGPGVDAWGRLALG